MKRILLLTAVVCGGLAGVCDAQTGDGWPESRLEAAGLRHSDVALMPEGTPEDYALFAPLRPTVVAWGEDALATLDGGAAAREKLAAAFAAYRNLGVRHVATNVWMLTATERYLDRHREYLDATCIDLWGDKILPRWLADAEYNGVKPWWGCTNNPRYVEHLLARMRAGLEAGATMVHLDDHAGTYACAAHAGGCFCEFCVDGFRAWLGQNVGAAELRAAGVENAADFDYRAVLRARGYADRKAFIAAAAKGEVPLWRWFLAFQREAAVALIGGMQAEAARVAGRPVAFGVNAYNLQPNQLFDARIVDYFANEVEQYGKEDLVSPVVYRLGEALGRPVFATGTGEDWIAYRKNKATTRARWWIAQAYAFGQQFMYSWRKWGFSEETGTLWTEVDPEVFRPMTAFVSEHPELFGGFDNAAKVGLLYDNASAGAGHWGVREASRALLDAGVPYRLVVEGDEILPRKLSADELGDVDVVVVPSDVVRSAALARTLADYEQRGGRVLEWRGGAEIQPSLPAQIEVKANGRVWALPRVRTAGASAGPRGVVHLLNRDYDAAKDAMIRRTAVQVVLRPAEIAGVSRVRSVRYFQPGQPARDLSFSEGDGGELKIHVPELELWGVLAFE